MESGLALHQVYDGVNLHEQFMHARDSDELPGWFDRKVIGPFVRELSQKQNARMRQTVEKAAEMPQESYESDISLDAFADRLKESGLRLVRRRRIMTEDGVLTDWEEVCVQRERMGEHEAQVRRSAG